MLIYLLMPLSCCCNVLVAVSSKLQDSESLSGSVVAGSDPAVPKLCSSASEPVCTVLYANGVSNSRSP